jgi:mycofactocin precursor
MVPDIVERRLAFRMDKEKLATAKDESQTTQEEPQVIEEIIVEELSIDGVCGVY